MVSRHLQPKHVVIQGKCKNEQRIIPRKTYLCTTHSPDEYPFTTDLPTPVIPGLSFPKILYPNKINTNPSILSFYVRFIVPRISRRASMVTAAKKRASGIAGDDEHDDGNYGSAATIDVEVLQAVSKRVHYGTFEPIFCHPYFIHSLRATGKFVSESKFVSNPSAFIPHIQTPNRAALEALITKPEVEQRLLQRLRKKAATYAQDFAADGEAVVSSNGSAKIDVDGVVELYESYIIPLTKEVEVGPSTPHGISLD